MFQKLSTQVAHICREKRKLLQGEQGLCILFLANPFTVQQNTFLEFISHMYEN
jgi:hypothetical protein